METRLPKSEISVVHRALQRKYAFDQFVDLADALLWRNQAVADQFDARNGPTERPNQSQVALATVALLYMESSNGGLLQFVWNRPGWLNHVSPSLRSVGLPALADLFERSISDLIAQIGPFAEFRKRDSLDAYSECAGEFEFDEFDSTFLEKEEEVQAKCVAFVSEHLADFVR